MRLFFFLVCGLFSLVASAAVATHPRTVPAGKHTSPVANLSASQIVAKNVAARGGLKAWRAVKTLTLSGRLEAGGEENPELPFVLRMKRQHKSRLEISFRDQTALQVYNGKQGWKVRPFLGRDEVEPFTPAEAKAAVEWQELDGPLVDFANKGIRVKLQGKDTVDGRKAYKLVLTMKDGTVKHLWVDAANFLELKAEGEPRKLDGKFHNVAIYYRDYKAENGLVVPHSFETVVEGNKQSYKMHVEQITVNQPMEDTLFAKPQLGLVKSSYK